MPGTTSVGSTPARQKAMLDHLITIGTATSKDVWPDDLKEIKGIGPQAEARLRRSGITSFRQLAVVDEETIRAVAGKSKIFGQHTRMEERIRGWTQQARNREDTATPEADLYLGIVKNCQGSFVQDGVVERREFLQSGRAVSVAYEIYDAPDDHPRSKGLAAALKEVAKSSVGRDGFSRVPKVQERHLDQLRAARDALGDDRTLDDRTLTQLNQTLEDAAVQLSLPGPYQSVTEVLAQQVANRDPDTAYGVYGAVPETGTAGNYVSTEYESPDSRFRAQGTNNRTMVMDTDDDELTESDTDSELDFTGDDDATQDDSDSDASGGEDSDADGSESVEPAAAAADAEEEAP